LIELDDGCRFQPPRPGPRWWHGIRRDDHSGRHRCVHTEGRAAPKAPPPVRSQCGPARRALRSGRVKPAGRVTATGRRSRAHPPRTGRQARTPIGPEAATRPPGTGRTGSQRLHGPTVARIGREWTLPGQPECRSARSKRGTAHARGSG
jgi:hypothetical protein